MYKYNNEETKRDQQVTTNYIQKSEIFDNTLAAEFVSIDPKKNQYMKIY